MGDIIEFVDHPTEPTPTPTEAELLARELLEAINALAARIPRLENRHPSTAGSAHRHRLVPKHFISSAVAAVEGTPLLQGVRKFDSDDARATMQYNEAFLPVARKLAALTADLKYTLEAERARIADAALQIYDIAKALARDPAGADVAVHVAILKRDLGRKGRKKKQEGE